MNVQRSEWLKSVDAAAYLGIAVGTLRNLTSQRRVPFGRRGRIVRYERAALDEWLRAGGCRRSQRSRREA